MGVQYSLHPNLAHSAGSKIVGTCARVAAKPYTLLKSTSRSYVGRHLFKRRVVKAISSNSALKLIIGASGQYNNGWIGTDIEYLNLLKPADWQEAFQPNQIDALLAEHVWEHLTLKDGLIAARQCHEYLKPGGYIRVAVPDGYCRDQDYVEWVRPGGSGVAADDHKVLYNHNTLARLFEDAGFKVALLEYFDEQGNFNQADWNPMDGKISRSREFDPRNADGELVYTSLIIDAQKAL